MGVVLWASAVFASLSAGFAMHVGLGASVPLAIAAGVVWGFVILAIDRAVIAGITAAPSTVRGIAVAAPRVVLALIIGTVIATPVVLQVFRAEIDSEIRVMHQESAVAFAEGLSRDTQVTTDARSNLQAKFEAYNEDNSGLLIRLEALQRMADRDSIIRILQLLLWMTFTCIGVLPVGLGLLSRGGSV